MSSTGTDSSARGITGVNGSTPACRVESLAIRLEPDLGLISDLVLCEDAYTQERALLEYILDRVQLRDLHGLRPQYFDDEGVRFRHRGDAALSSSADNRQINLASHSSSAKWSYVARPRRERLQ